MNKSLLAGAFAVAALMLQTGFASATTQGDQTVREPIVISADDPVLNKANLDRVKRRIIALGNRCTYVNMYNNNPCWSLASYSFYLNPDPGPDGHPQWNINCDLTRGDFNTLVVRDASSGRFAAVDFRPGEAIFFRSYAAAGEASSRLEQDQVVFRAAVAAALEVIECR